MSRLLLALVGLSVCVPCHGTLDATAVIQGGHFVQYNYMYPSSYVYQRPAGYYLAAYMIAAAWGDPSVHFFWWVSEPCVVSCSQGQGPTQCVDGVLPPTMAGLDLTTTAFEEPYPTYPLPGASPGVCAPCAAGSYGAGPGVCAPCGAGSYARSEEVV